MSKIDDMLIRCKSKTHWVTKDDKKIPIISMSDSHLVNTIKFLLRRSSDSIIMRENRSLYHNMTPKMFLNQNCPPFSSMLREAKRRCLDIEDSE